MTASPSPRLELLPCPFCGSPADFEDTQKSERSKTTTWAVGCTNSECIVYQTFDTFARKVEAAAAWNRRPSIAPTASQGTEGKPDKGMVSVPVEPSEEMIDEAMYTLMSMEITCLEGAGHQYQIQTTAPKDVWRVMVRAALRSERAEGEAGA